MINDEWKKNPQNDAPFVAFYDMQFVKFVLPVDRNTAVVYSYTLFKPHGV